MYKAFINEKVELEINRDENKFSIGEGRIDLDQVKLSEKSFHIIKNGRSFSIDVLKSDLDAKSFLVKVNGNEYSILLKDSSDILLNKLGIALNHSEVALEIKAPMPGLILDVIVKEGSEIKKGEPLLILEAMKMENVLKSSRDGIVKSILVSKGNSVEKNQILVKF